MFFADATSSKSVEYQRMMSRVLLFTYFLTACCAPGAQPAIKPIRLFFPPRFRERDAAQTIYLAAKASDILEKVRRARAALA
jgi:hypothetical protein